MVVSSFFPVRPSVAAQFARLTLGRGRRRRFEVAPLDDVPTRYRAGIDWLVRAQDEAASGGVPGGISYGYSLRGGWRKAYPETTGYIAPTLWDAAVRLDRPELAGRAAAAVEWLLTVQHDNGSIPNPLLGLDDGVVFDTGQVLFGFTRAFAETGDERFAAAARRARRWLVTIADDDGRWTRNTFNGIAHAYNARTAWAVVESCQADPDPDALGGCPGQPRLGSVPRTRWVVRTGGVRVGRNGVHPYHRLHDSWSARKRAFARGRGDDRGRSASGDHGGSRGGRRRFLGRSIRFGRRPDRFVLLLDG